MEMETEPSMAPGQQYEIVRSEEVNLEYDLFKRLSNAPEDFKMIVNKETLTQIIHCFQVNANTQIKQFFEREFTQRQPIIMEAIQNKYKSTLSQSNSLQVAYENELKTQQSLQEEQINLEMQFKQMKEEQISLQNKINQIEMALNSFDEKSGERIQSYQNLIAKTNAEKQRKQDEIQKVINVHNSITEEYNKLQQALNKYQQAYAKVQGEIEELKHRLNNK